MHPLAEPRLKILIVLATLLLAGAALAPGAAAGDRSAESGDVNCDATVNSIDAALLLQFEAALKDSFACPDASDVDGDGAVSSVDARLVLEFDAGLHENLVRMYLTVTEPAGLCDVQAKPTSCDIPVGSNFRLAVMLHGVPLEGYIAFQTQVFIDRLLYEPTDFPRDEILWPENLLPVRFINRDDPMAGYVAHGSLSNLVEPFPLSSYQGALVELDMTCPAKSSTYDVSLLAYEPFPPLATLSGNKLGASISLRTNLETVSPIKIGRADLDLNLDGSIDGHFEASRPIASELEINCV